MALNAYEGSGGDITNIQIDGLFARGCHSAVRLLTVHHRVEHIHISNVFGTYYQYCIGLTKFYPGETTGYFDAIVLENIHAAKAKRLPIQEAHMRNKNRHYPFLWVQKNVRVKHLDVSHLHRREENNPIETVCIDENAEVEVLNLQDLSLENRTDAPCALFVNNGKIKRLCAWGIPKEELQNRGVIETLELH